MRWQSGCPSWLSVQTWSLGPPRDPVNHNPSMQYTALGVNWSECILLTAIEINWARVELTLILQSTLGFIKHFHIQ